MSRVAVDLEHGTLVECKYRYPDAVLDDIRKVTGVYPDLHLYVDFYYYRNNDRKKLVNLGGTIAVCYEGHTYNIPVCLWIHETHPHSPPRCYVRPSASMIINTKSSCVDASGQVLLHCLTNWKIGWSNLLIVLEEMRAAFQRETPLFATLPTRSRTPALQQHPHVGTQGETSYGSWPHPSNVHQKFNTKPRMSSTSLTHPASNTLPKSSKVSQPHDSSGEVSGVRRSYTQELLDLGITFEGPAVQTNHPTNPFITNASAPNTSPSDQDDLDNLFKSLQLEKVVNMYQLGNKDKDMSYTWRQKQAFGEDPCIPSGLVDDRHRLVVNHLPQGVCPKRMKNKLTIYFQRRQNEGGEILDVKYPAAQPDQACITFRDPRVAAQVLKEPQRVITINDRQFPIQLKKFEGSQIAIPDGIQGEKAYMFRSLMSLEGRSFSPAEVLEAVQACRDLPSALKFLCHECPICQEQVSFSKMITMTHCSCAFCEQCFKTYFSSVIKEKSIVFAVCPICNQPDIRGAGRMEESMDYFNLLDTQIKHYLEPQTHELFQRKLRDQALQEMPNFRWCAHCSFGMLHEVNRLRMDCPSCRKSTCSQCKSAWAPQHESLSCEKFKEWQLLNNPEYQNTQLEHFLSRNKIDCPKCKFRFYLAKGGCLHFRCTECQHEFCGGCSRPFKMGSGCDFSADCGAKGLHAHHPRDCLYHLRDWNVPRLQRLLQHHNVVHPFLLRQTKSAAGDLRGVCAVMELKETGDVKEEPCGRQAYVEYSGYCQLHFKECLVELINQKGLDPVVLYDGPEIRAELQRWKLPIPEKHPQESEQVYLHRLRQILTERVGLRGEICPERKRPGPPPSTLSTRAAPAWYSALNISARAPSEDTQLLMLFNE
ncbi:uncharacterized protein LOC115812065 [Chanos chanos]|uniref:Uncharacterized protein LOC115812065 n=1 Tax=Chanos chanos TaxID=29144 RepID=A0A6J2VF15_CHACN|nr:uncharacterized protein LOC115812065 [Chanos chanos]